LKLKLDENLGRQVAALLREAGHDVQTVPGEGLSGAADQTVWAAATAEERVLVTLDLDFADPIRFRPAAGVVVLRLPVNSSPSYLLLLAGQLVRALVTHSPVQTLWIVEPGRLRIRQTEI